MWRALARDEVIGPRLAASFDHVLIDEYQDVNGLQVDLARALGGFGCCVTAVGDDFQAIYGFRSASADHILSFPSHFEGTTVVTLERNYRSVAAGAGRRATRSPRRPCARSRSACAPTARAASRPRVVFVRDEAAQAEEVCNRGSGGARAGLAAARPGGAGAHLARLRPAGARALPPAHPVRQVRRAAVPRGRARQGLRRGAAAGRQRRRRRRLVPRAAADRGRRPGQRARAPVAAMSASGRRDRWPSLTPRDEVGDGPPRPRCRTGSRPGRRRARRSLRGPERAPTR